MFFFLSLSLSLKDEMIGRVLLNNLSFSAKSSASHLFNPYKCRILARYHSDSLEDSPPEEPAFEEQRLSSGEATKILRTHEASIDLEGNCPVKYYEVNYLGANNPPGMSKTRLNIHSPLFSRGSTSTSTNSFSDFIYVPLRCI